jgi:hypothetical protein
MFSYILRHLQNKINFKCLYYIPIFDKNQLLKRRSFLLLYIYFVFNTQNKSSSYVKGDFMVPKRSRRGADMTQAAMMNPTTPPVRNIVALLAIRFALLVFLPAQAPPSSATGSGGACAS